MNPLTRILAIIDHEGQILLVSQVDLLMYDKVSAKRNRHVRHIFNIRQQRAKTHLDRKAGERDGKVIGIVQIPAVFEDEVDPFQ